MTNGGWTPERRLAQSRRARRYWSTPEGQRRREQLRAAAAERWAKFVERWPERARLVEITRTSLQLGAIEALNCDQNCGRRGQPLYDWDKLELAGWRCYECRKRDRSATEKTTPDEAQLGLVGGAETETVTPPQREVSSVSRSPVAPAAPRPR